MWGNSRGWIISAVMAVVMALLLFLIAKPQDITPPTNSLPQGMEAAALPVDPATVFTAGTKDCDATDLYHEAIADYNAHQMDYDDMSRNVTQSRHGDPKGVNLLIEATECGKGKLFAADPSEVINYENNRASLSALNAVGNLTNQIALLNKADKKPDKARIHANAAFALGLRMYNERLVFEEWSDGVSLMASAADVLAGVDESKRDALSEFSVQASNYRTTKIQPLWTVISGVGDEQIAMYAGDIFQWAFNSHERMWKVESILKLGRYKFNAARNGDLFGAKRELRRMANDPSLDPVVHTAAAAAHELTVEKYHMIGGSQ